MYFGGMTHSVVFWAEACFVGPDCWTGGRAWALEAGLGLSGRSATELEEKERPEEPLRDGETEVWAGE